MPFNIPEIHVRQAGKAVVSVALLAAVAAYLLRTGAFEPPVGLRPSLVLLAAALLLGNALLAGWRLSVLCGLEGHPLAMGTALRANAAGAALSQVMINFLGQAAGRVAILRKAGIPAEVTISVSVIERLTATMVLTGATLVAALYLFGKISFGQGSETEYLLEAGIGIAAATLLAGTFVYRNLLFDILRQLDFWKIGRGFFAIAGISLAIHGAMLAAYLALASEFVENVMPADLVAACLIVMFTASLPISFGGWGVRELSAAAVLPYAGLTVTQGVFVGLLVGIGSLAVHLPIWLAVPAQKPEKCAMAQAATRGIGSPEQASQSYSSWLGLLIPVLTSIAILFNLHLPTADGDLNINLADPLAIVGGVLSMAYWYERGLLPRWQVPWLNLLTALTLAVLVLATAIGFLEFGFSAWAFRNRLLGWLLLLAYAATGALTVMMRGDGGRKTVLKGLVVAIATIAALDIARLAYSLLGWTFLGEVEPTSLQGFSQNSNAFAFLLVTSICAAIAIIRETTSRGQTRIWVSIAALNGAALVLTGSRAGWGTLAIIGVAALLIDRRLTRPVLKAVVVGSALLLVATQLPTFTLEAGSTDNGLNVFALQSAPKANTVSDTARWETIEGGLRLWWAHPIFGAGLGAYLAESKETGEPLVIHNTLVWLLAESGLLGFLVFFAAGLTILWASTRRLRDPTDAGAATVFLVLLAFASMSMVHELLYQRVLWFVLGICLASIPSGLANAPTRNGS